jgi:hypothetical protein
MRCLSLERQDEQRGLGQISHPAGFTRTDAPLSAMLQFSTPLVNSISSWPEQQADITHKLSLDTEVPPAISVGRRACHRRGGDHRGGINGCIL